LPSTFEITVTSEDYRYPQVLKTNLAVDQKLPFGFIGTVEVLYNRNLNAILYYNANQKASVGNFTGPDTRPRFPGAIGSNTGFSTPTRQVSNVSNAVVMTTTDQGSYLGTTFKLEYPERKGLYGMAAYTFSRAQDLMDAGSIASGSFTGARSINGNNALDLTYSNQDIPHRIIGLLSYATSFGEKNGGKTQFTLGYEGLQSGRYSYTYLRDLNGDGVTGNDLLFVPTNASDLVFEDIKDAAGVVTTTGARQAELYEEYIKQDAYLSGLRGQYTERNGAILPWLHRFDLAVARDFWFKTGKNKKHNAVQFRVDIFNVGNLINSDWGIGRRFVTTSPLQARGVDANGVPRYQVASNLLNRTSRKTIDYSAALSDVWNLQLGIRYTFE
jgi:hypothetical protein